MSLVRKAPKALEYSYLNLHPVGVSRVEFSVENDGFFDEGTVGADHVQNGDLKHDIG